MLPQSVDRLTRELRKHAEDNCKVFKSYSLHHMFRVSPEMAERLRQRETGLPATGHGAHTAEEEAAVDAELAELQERAHAVRTHRRVGRMQESLKFGSSVVACAGYCYTGSSAAGAERA